MNKDLASVVVIYIYLDDEDEKGGVVFERFAFWFSFSAAAISCVVFFLFCLSAAIFYILRCRGCLCVRKRERERARESDWD